MKNFAIFVLLSTSVIFGALYFRQKSQGSRTEARIADLETAVNNKDAGAKKAAVAEKKVKQLRERLTESTITAAEKSSEVAQLEQQLAAVQTNASNGFKGFGEMFKSPEMREMIKTQQKAFMGPVIEKTYSPLFSQLQLNDEQKTYVKDLLEKKMLIGAQSGMELLKGNLDKAKREELAKKIKDEGDGYTEQIKQFLGEANYAQFEHYENTLAERMQIGQFRDQLSGSNTPLSGEQEQQLIQALSEERTNFQWTAEYSKTSKVSPEMADMFSEERLNAFAKDKARYDEKALARALQILPPEQYTSFEKFVNAQREMQISMMKISAQMFAPKEK